MRSPDNRKIIDFGAYADPEATETSAGNRAEVFAAWVEASSCLYFPEPDNSPPIGLVKHVEAYQNLRRVLDASLQGDSHSTVRTTRPRRISIPVHQKQS